jgi:MFS family permease
MSRITSLLQLYLLFGVAVALATSGSFVPLASTVAKWFVAKRGLMTGLVLSGYGAGAMLGPPVAERLIATSGWRAAFLVMGGTACLLVLIVAQLLARDPGIDEPNPMGAVSGFAGLSRSQAARTRELWILFFVSVFYGVGQMALTVHLVPYITDLRMSAHLAASVLAVAGALNGVGRIGAGMIGDRVGNKPALVVSLALLSLSFLLLPVCRTPGLFYVFAVVFGFGNGGVAALSSPLVAQLFGMRAHGAILGIVILAVGIGAAVGPTLAGYVFDLTENYRISFTVFAVLSVAGVGLAAALRPGLEALEVGA